MMETTDLTPEECETPPIKAHWFYSPAGKDSWLPFSMSDNAKLDHAFQSGQQNADVFGRRFHADLSQLTIQPIYWENEGTISIRRSWWYTVPTNNVQDWVPFSQLECETLETAYSNALSLNAWPVSVSLTGIGRVVMENAALTKMYPVDESGQLRDSSLQIDPLKSDYVVLGNLSGGKPLRREFGPEFYATLPPNEPDTFDHLVLVVHGIGEFGDLRFRRIPECVADLRALTQNMMQYHNIIPDASPQKAATTTNNPITENNNNNSGAVEFLPIQWHEALHKGELNLTDKLNRISLDSCGKIRSFVNETLLDVLLFTSPVYHQAIVENVVSEINRVYSLFRTKHPKFEGKISLIGHSLGSVIVFDILTNQSASLNFTQLLLGPCHSHNETKLLFEPYIFFALGSPLGMFLTVSGVSSIPADYSLPNSTQIYNIYHPFDPVAYRIEPLITQNVAAELSTPPAPFLIPHHRGRKRLHLEVKDIVVKVGDDIRRRVVGSLQSMAVFFKRTPSFTSSASSSTIDQAVAATELTSSMLETGEEIVEEQIQSPAPSSQSTSPYSFGALNGQKRIDYVLQEGPIEIVNPYLFSIASHLCYWQSEDTCLFMARALYDLRS